MEKRLTLGVIGCGNMGGAIVRGLLEHNRTAERPRFGRIVATTNSEETRRALREALQIEAVAMANEAVKDADVVLLAVKPQVMPGVLDALGDTCAGKLVVSVAAGVRADTIAAKLPGARVVRTMPNTPLTVGEGAVAVVTGGVSDDDFHTVRDLFPGGLIVEVGEDQIDAATAVSGSGPAYFYAFTEALTAAGVDAGLDRDQAKMLAERTFLGAAELFSKQAGDNALIKLRQAVTSPNGTTAAALDAFERNGLRDVVKQSVLAARDRGRELSGQ